MLKKQKKFFHPIFNFFEEKMREIGEWSFHLVGGTVYRVAKTKEYFLMVCLRGSLPREIYLFREKGDVKLEELKTIPAKQFMISKRYQSYRHLLGLILLGLQEMER